MDFTENALFKSSGDIYWSSLPSWLLGQLSVDKWDSDGFITSRLVCRTSDNSYNSTDLSLVIVDFQQSFVASEFFVCTKTADYACQAYTCMACYVIMYNHIISSRCPELSLHNTGAWVQHHHTLIQHSISYTILCVHVQVGQLASGWGFCTIVLHFNSFRCHYWQLSCSCVHTCTCSYCRSRLVSLV